MTRGPIFGIYFPTYGDGGVERMMINLARGLASLDVAVDFLVDRQSGPYLAQLPQGVDLIELGPFHPRSAATALARYLRAAQPGLVMQVKRCGKEILTARRLAQTQTRIALRTGTTESQKLKSRSRLKRWRLTREIRKYLPQMDIVVAVSAGVAEDITTLAGLDPKRVACIKNPVITPEMPTLAASEVAHPWFREKGTAVIVAAGGLRRAKGFDTLIRAFAQVRAQLEAHLVILGRGRQQGRLQRLAKELNIDADLSMPGFAENPYAYFAKADVFVLSSRWEGSPNVITEALALGTPVVSTDCRSGPREILANGRHGELVAVDDVDAMAAAIIRTLKAPRDPAALQAAVTDYTMTASARVYRDLMPTGR